MKGIVAITLCLAVGAVTLQAASDPPRKWEAPARADRTHNPIPADEKSVRLGHAVFTANCIACHGEGGKGDGILAISLPVRPADLTEPAVWQQSDGALFWKISEGRAPMPSWKAQLKEEERWNVINYIRATFGPKVASAKK